MADVAKVLVGSQASDDCLCLTAGSDGDGVERLARRGGFGCDYESDCVGDLFVGAMILDYSAE